MLFGKRSREPEIKFDPDKQYAIIRSSICTGEKVAGFKNKEDGHFTERTIGRTFSLTQQKVIP